ncbi:MAG: CopG family transcriptional regulator [Thermoanaerobaculia bacterium]
MIRTQISLQENDYRQAKAEARRQGISLAELLRRSIGETLEDRARHTKPWMRYAGSVDSGDPRASRTVDEVIYGRPRP